MNKYTPLIPLVLTLGSLSSAGVASAKTPDFILPPTVSIPAGEFYMGSDRGLDDEKPVHKVSVPAFQMGKYEVTLAEFRKFVEATGYQTSDKCMHRIGERWFGSGEKDGSWDNNIYATNEYYPVVCVSRTDAVNYAKWLSEKTGQQYRLPTEAEWEYTLRAGTSTRYFYGDDENSARACDYANLSDMHAKAMSGKLYNAPYTSNYTIQPCSDNEVLLSVVGLYRPNPFGVYDMLGNVMERLADCYRDSYEGAPTDGSAVVSAGCDTYVARGGSWHWEAFTSSSRNRVGEDFLAALEGFRLVLDTDGKALPSQAGDRAFAKQLAAAQAKARDQHRQVARYPGAPRGVTLVTANREEVQLTWQSNSEDFVTGYQVYRQDLQNGDKAPLGKPVKRPGFVDKTPLPHNARYWVEALNGDTPSLPSISVDSDHAIRHTLPGKIQGEAFSHGPDVKVNQSVMEPADDKVFGSLSDKQAVYQIHIDKPGRYRAAARVYHSGQPQAFELWLGDQQLAAPSLTGEQGWHTVNNIDFELPAGRHELRIKGRQSRFAVNWLDIKAL